MIPDHVDDLHHGYRLFIAITVITATAVVLLARMAAAPPPAPPTSTTTRPTTTTLMLAAGLEHAGAGEASRGAPRTTAALAAVAGPLQEVRDDREHPSASSLVAKPEQAQVSGYGYGGAYLGRFRVTCYGPPLFPAGQRTATGDPVGPGSVAVDPNRIHLGTRLRIGDLGAATANDTGGAVHGAHLDLWRPSCKGWDNPTVDVWSIQ